MKYTKYLVFIVLIMIFSVDKIYAETCYYQIAGQNSLSYDTSNGYFKIADADGERVKWYQVIKKSEKILNFNKDFDDEKETGIKVEAIPGGTCPNQIVFRTTGSSDGIFGFNDSVKASEFLYATKEIEGMDASLISRSYITQEQYEANLLANNEGRITPNGINQNGNYGTDSIDTSEEVMTCEELFDSSVIELINDILRYPRYIVPAIVIVLGTLDLFKAVIAGKEDEMKKAQKTFIKRVIIGVCVFLVPLLINAIIWLANIAWQGLGYTTCSL